MSFSSEGIKSFFKKDSASNRGLRFFAAGLLLLSAAVCIKRSSLPREQSEKAAELQDKAAISYLKSQQLDRAMLAAMMETSADGD